MSTEPLLDVRGLSKSYGGRAVLVDVTFALERGGVLGLVGSSGSGKSTLARCIAGMERADAGAVRFAGDAHEVQLIFQQPAETLNPRFTAAEIVEEPLVIRRCGSKAERRERSARALELVGIARSAMDKRAHEFSGGERQRLAIARAMVLEPKLLILDESFNGLDAALAVQIAGLLEDLRARVGLACIVISHDLELIAGLAEWIGVMESGRLVEFGPAGDVIGAPSHARTRELIEASRALGAIA